MQNLTVLMYHALYKNEDEYDNLLDEEKPYAVSCKQFEEHLLALISNGYKIVTTVDLETTRHKKLAIITFDDGHKSFFNHALPILKKHTLKGIFFITTDLISQREDFCSWENIKILHNEGMEIGSHGKTHKFFNSMSDTASHEELVHSKTAIQKAIDANISTISFPGGRFGKREINIGSEIGYQHFFTSTFGVNSSNSAPSNIYRRIAVRNNTSAKLLTELSDPTSRKHKTTKIISKLKHDLKKVLGNKAYHFAYIIKSNFFRNT